MWQRITTRHKTLVLQHATNRQALRYIGRSINNFLLHSRVRSIYERTIPRFPSHRVKGMELLMSQCSFAKRVEICFVLKHRIESILQFQLSLAIGGSIIRRFKTCYSRFCAMHWGVAPRSKWTSWRSYPRVQLMNLLLRIFDHNSQGYRCKYIVTLQVLKNWKTAETNAYMQNEQLKKPYGLLDEEHDHSSWRVGGQEGWVASQCSPRLTTVALDSWPQRCTFDSNSPRKCEIHPKEKGT